MKLLFWSPLLGLALAGCAGQSAVETTPLALATGSGAHVPKTQLVADATTNDNAFGLSLPKGFSISVFAEGLDRPRRIAVVPNPKQKRGFDLLVSQSYVGNVVLLRDSTGAGRADQKFDFASGLNQPYGIAFRAGQVYLAGTDAVFRFPFVAGQTKVEGAGQKIADLTRGGYNNHWTRNLLFDKTGNKLFVTVGSSCNVCEETDPQRAAISEMNPDGSDRRLFATGMRNPTGIAWRPNTDQLWTVVNERDLLGDDTPPDYLTSVKANHFYGWPYAYTSEAKKVVPDPTFGAKNPAKVAETTSPDVPVQAHSAAVGLAFYPNSGGSFPREYRGDAFLAFHGSWNRSNPTGYKIVRVHDVGGKAQISDFVSGFLKSDGSKWGRPVDIQLAPDGSLLFSDDDGGKIWRVSYTGLQPARSATAQGKKVS